MSSDYTGDVYGRSGREEGDDICFRTKHRVTQLQSDLEHLKEEQEKLTQEVWGSPGSADSGLKTSLTKLALEMSAIKKIGWAVAGLVLTDVVTRVLLAAHMASTVK